MLISEAQRRARGGSKPNPPADYVVSNDAEWDAVFANSAATLSGKVIKVSGSNFTERTINGKDMDAEGGPLTIRSANNNSSLPTLVLSGTTRGITFSGLNFQMTGWPKTYDRCVQFGTGTFGALRFEDCSFRHGYESGLSDFDTAADLPEYTRIDNVQTATTSSATYALSWNDAAATGGLVEFFNRGTETVYVAFGGAGVTASAADTECLPGQRTRISGLDPSTDTHFAIIAAANPSEVNARAEIGLPYYLAEAFNSSGTATIEDIEIVGCNFRDLTHGIKGVRRPDRIVVMDCDFDRIYSDVFATTPDLGGEAWFMRNTISVQFARSGASEIEDGDAVDPHGDAFQMFGDGTYTAGPVYIAGNRMRVSPLRPGVTHQGLYITSNDFDPSYTDIFSVSNMLIGGSINSYSLGVAGFPVRDSYHYGITIVRHSDATSTAPRPNIVSDGGGTNYFGSFIAPVFNEADQPVEKDGLLVFADVASVPALFPNFGGLAAASKREDIEAAITPAAEGLGLGAVAAAGAIDWDTSDYTAVLKWENMPSGAHWNDLTFQPLSTLTELPLRRILNRRAQQTVSAGAGTEWRSVDTDGLTEVQAWTSAPGMIEPDQFIQIRATTSASSNTGVTASVTINGFAQNVSLTTVTEPATYLVQTSGYLVDPSNLPSGVAKLRFEGFFRFPSGSFPSGQKPFAKVSTGCDLAIGSNGNLVATAEGSTGGKVLQNTVVGGPGSIVADEWQYLVFEVDHTAEECTISINGDETVTTFINASNGAFQVFPVSFIATSSGLAILPSGTEFANLSIYVDDVLHKQFSNDAATINADAWKAGADFMQGAA